MLELTVPLKSLRYKVGHMVTMGIDQRKIRNMGTMRIDQRNTRIKGSLV